MPLPPRAQAPPINPEIDRLLYQVSVIRQEAEGLVWGLNDSQFNWSPGRDSWSIGQCFDHLNATNKGFIRNLKPAMEKGRSDGLLSEGPFVYGFFSRWLLKQMMPPVRKKFNAPSRLQPASTLEMKPVLEEWNTTHEQIGELMREASGLDLAKIKIVSPATSLLRYSVGMAFWILTAHDRRHLYQVRQVRNDKRFPQ